jgi:hypothetical protein
MQETDGSRIEEVLRHSRVIRSETGQLIAELREMGEQFRQTLDLQGRMERHPYLTRAAAAGVGYVLGGGLFTRLTARALKLGVRALLLPLARHEIEALVSGVANGGERGGWAPGSEDGEGGL